MHTYSYIITHEPSVYSTIDTGQDDNTKKTCRSRTHHIGNLHKPEPQTYGTYSKLKLKFRIANWNVPQVPGGGVFGFTCCSTMR